MREAFLCLPLFIGVFTGAQQPSTMGNPSPQMSTYAGQREALLAPGNDAMQRRDYATALRDCRIVLAAYPNDSRVLMITGNAAWASGELEQAAEYFRRSLAGPGDHPWGVRFSLLQVNAALGRWGEFAQEEEAARDAVISSRTGLGGAEKSFTLERWMIGPQLIEVIEYAAPNRAKGVRYSFLFGGLPASHEMFTPHVDLVETSGNNHDFSLEQYFVPQKKNSIRSYAEGKPPYQQVRGEVLRLLETQFNTTLVRPLSPFPQ
jgi:tetratricopeptide (TPR) repeat protein